MDKLRARGEDGNRMIAKSGSLNLRSIVLDAGRTTPGVQPPDAVRRLVTR